MNETSVNGRDKSLPKDRMLGTASIVIGLAGEWTQCIDFYVAKSRINDYEDEIIRGATPAHRPSVPALQVQSKNGTPPISYAWKNDICTTERGSNARLLNATCVTPSITTGHVKSLRLDNDIYTRHMVPFHGH